MPEEEWGCSLAGAPRGQGFERCGITVEPAQSLLLGMLNVQAVSFSGRMIFISFLLNITPSLGLVVDRLRELAVPFLKLRG